VTDSREIRAELAREHEEIDQELQALASAGESGESANVQAAWDEFESRLLAHLELEERELFPLVESVHPQEVEALRREHEVIRRTVARLGVRSDLHTLPKATIDAFVKLLESHAEREDLTLYRWADELAPLGSRRHLFGLLARGARAAVARSSPKT
jgi:hemerythrin-like domain-containing protein